MSLWLPMAHHERELPEPELTPEEAKFRVQVEGIRKAVILCSTVKLLLMKLMVNKR